MYNVDMYNIIYRKYKISQNDKFVQKQINKLNKKIVGRVSNNFSDTHSALAKPNFRRLFVVYIYIYVL